MENRIAVEKMKYLKPNPVFIVHRNVVELNKEQAEAAEEFNKRINANNRPGFLNKNAKKEFRTYKCNDCGAIWTENIHAPLLMTRAEVNHFYPHAVNCSILK